MNRRFFKRYAPMLILPLLLIALACTSGDSAPTPEVSTPTSEVSAPAPEAKVSPVLNVVTTIYPVTYFAERVGGDRTTVESLIKAGVDAHDFEPTPSDIIKISNADVLVYNHPAFESWVADAVSTSASESLIVVKAADLPEDIEFKDAHGHAHGDEHGDEHETLLDPHVWLNPVEAVEQVRAIQAAFTNADQAGASTYAENADVLIAELLALDKKFIEGLESCALDQVIVSHEAYGHMAERYSFEQIGLSGLSTETEPGPQRIAKIIDEIKILGVSHVLQEPVGNQELAESVASETDTEVLPFHPMESLTPAEFDSGETYFSIMDENLKSLRAALRCE